MQAPIVQLDPNVLTGINIQNYPTPWVDMILSGEKTIETRNQDNLKSYVGKKMGIIETQTGQAKLVGYMVLGNAIKYTTRTDFMKDIRMHRFFFPIEETFIVKYGYPIIRVEKLDTPFLINSRGIVSRKLI